MGAAGALGGAASNGDPAAQLQSAPLIVPLIAPALLAIVMPASSLHPQRATSPVALPVISVFIAAWTWSCVRARLQTRASSIAPFQNPAATPVEVSALAIEACSVLLEATGRPTTSWVSSTPFRNSCQVLPS